MVSKSLRNFTISATLLAIISNFYIYTYPSANPGSCSWRCAVKDEIPNDLSTWEKAVLFTNNYFLDIQAQFSSNSNTAKNDALTVHLMAFGDPQIKGIWKKTSYLGRLDVIGNDYYLGHIYSMMKQRLNPSYIVVMGDLYSSQWIGDQEFYNRASRYMRRIFQRNISWLKPLKEENMDEDGDFQVNWNNWGDVYNAHKKAIPWSFEYNYSDVKSWEPERDDFLFINITGNHDIGYSGDTTYQHMARYSTFFGKDNYWIEYETDTDHAWRIVVLNSLLLEGPALQPEFIETNWHFLRELSARNFTGSTILLSHVPFYKIEGLCSDGPEFRYYPEGFEREPYKANLLRSQNHLSEDVSNQVLNLIFNNGKPGIVLTGHDHEGCETIYNKSKNGTTWNCTTDIRNPDHYVKEVTVRAMMGAFNGNTGLVTGLFDKSKDTWEWHFNLCPFAIQHIWYIAKVSLLFSILSWPLLILL